MNPVPFKSANSVGPISLDAIESVLNPARSSNLRHILTYTPLRLRPAIALTFSELTMMQLAGMTGLPRSSINEWLCGGVRLPLGAAVRMSRVFGVPAEELFEGWF